MFARLRGVRAGADIEALIDATPPVAAALELAVEGLGAQAGILARLVTRRADLQMPGDEAAQLRSRFAEADWRDHLFYFAKGGIDEKERWAYFLCTSMFADCTWFYLPEPASQRKTSNTRLVVHRSLVYLGMLRELAGVSEAADRERWISLYSSLQDVDSDTARKKFDFAHTRAAPHLVCDVMAGRHSKYSRHLRDYFVERAQWLGLDPPQPQTKGPGGGGVSPLTPPEGDAPMEIRAPKLAPPLLDAEARGAFAAYGLWEMHQIGASETELVEQLALMRGNLDGAQARADFDAGLCATVDELARREAHDPSIQAVAALLRKPPAPRFGRWAVGLIALAKVAAGELRRRRQTRQWVVAVLAVTAAAIIALALWTRPSQRPHDGLDETFAASAELRQRALALTWPEPSFSLKGPQDEADFASLVLAAAWDESAQRGGQVVDRRIPDTRCAQLATKLGQALARRRLAAIAGVEHAPALPEPRADILACAKVTGQPRALLEQRLERWQATDSDPDALAAAILDALLR